MSDKTIQVLETKPSLSLDDPGRFATALKVEGERRKLLQEYIKGQLIEGTDYGQIKIGNSLSKPCLFKAGAEKFISLLNLRPEFGEDKETMAMLPQAVRDAGVVCYVCYLRHRETGAIIAEGRGACQLSEKKGNVNVSIKIAMKRSQVDAVLRIGLSDTFTQDLEEMATEPVAKNFPSVAEENRVKDSITSLLIVKNAPDKIVQELVELGKLPYNRLKKAEEYLKTLPDREVI